MIDLIPMHHPTEPEATPKAAPAPTTNNQYFIGLELPREASASPVQNELLWNENLADLIVSCAAREKIYETNNRSLGCSA
jgi:hypothetical protein